MIKQGLELKQQQKLSPLQIQTIKLIELPIQELEQRIRKFLADFDAEASEQRIVTEAAIFADKAAIDEELVRLDSHFKAFREIVTSDEAAGRKLDFLVQEINRETNTIGSKAGNAEIAHLVVDMKTEIEKIREQIQNLE